MSDAVLQTGLLLWVGDGDLASTPTYTELAEQVTIAPPRLFRNEVDVSNHNEGEDAFVPGMRRKDPVTFRINWITDDTNHQQLFDDYNDAVKRAYQLRWPTPDTTKATFDAYVLRFAPVEGTLDSAKQVDITLRIAGQVDYSFV